MKLYSLLILTKNTKKSKKKFRAPKKSEKNYIFRSYIAKTNQQYTTLYTRYSHVLNREIKAIAANWPLIGVL